MSWAIKVENLGKLYAINSERSNRIKSLRDLFSFHRALPDPADGASPADATEFWALKDMSFEVQEGERIGVIGANGAGKSTLLKILSRITPPTEGKVQIRGKMASLLEVGTGFHPEMSGRENIFLGGAILGMGRGEIRRKFDQIVEFSGVEKFIDTPVKYFSSGMYVRLAFAVSSWLEPDVLIIDEVLSVGDLAFQRKCVERIKELTQEGRTVLFVSHSTATINKMCHKALFLEQGRMVSFKPVQEATQEYIEHITETVDPEKTWHRATYSCDDSDVTVQIDREGEVQGISGSVVGPSGRASALLPLEEPFELHLTYRVLKDLPHRVIPSFHIYNEFFDEKIFISYPEKAFPNRIGEYKAVCVIPPFQLNVGRFTIMPHLNSYDVTPHVYFAAWEAFRIEIYETIEKDPRRHGCLVPIPGTSRPRLSWRLRNSDGKTFDM